MDSSILIAPDHADALPLAAAACANCAAPRMGEYCHACGQHFLEGRLTIRRLVRDFLIRKLGLEGGLLRTIVDLTVRPASMMRQYIDGRRQRYTNPVAYLLLSGGAYVMLYWMWSETMAAGLRSTNADPESSAAAESLVRINLYMDTHPSLTTVILCLILVPALRLLFRRTTTTVEASVFALYVSGHLLLMQILINIAAAIFSTDPYRVMTGWLTFVPTLMLLFWAGRFFGSGFSTMVKLAIAVAVSLIGFFTLVIIAAGLMIALESVAPVAAA